MQSIHAQVVINEVYGGGGNSGATYTNDFIELYNNGNASVSISGWSVQYASATGSTWQVTNLSGSIPAHSFYLVQEAVGAGGTVALPSPDATGTIAMGAGGGKVLLVNVTTAQTGTNPTGSQIIDFVGFGNASTFEGTGPTPVPSATNSVQRSPIGFDSNQNSTDFVLSSPSPSNSGTSPDAVPPTVNAFLPADDAANVATNTNLSITFSEPVTVSKGFLKINNQTRNSFDLVDVATPNVSVTGSTVTIYGVNLQPGSNYNVIVADTNFKDVAGNGYAGFTSTATWNFTTSGTAVSPVSGILNTTYNLNILTNVFGNDGFRQFSVTGGLTWAMTTFGRTEASTTASGPYGLQMNGYDNIIASNTPNEDWLISPAFDLSTTTYPLLSFWSRTRFNGSPLQLKISSDYPGSGDPRDYTWTDLNGRFPAQTSDVWTQSLNVNLSAFKQSNVFLAFVYISTNEEGARWTLDDIRIDNSATPPPPTITVNTTDIQLGYAASGSSSTKTFTFTGNDINSPISLTATDNFLLSQDGTNFLPSIAYPIEANNTLNTVYVRFVPGENDKDYTGTITINTSNISSSISLKGTSIDIAKTLEVVNWNLEWFGSTGFGPTNENLQEQNISTILQSIGADIYGLVEVVDTARLGRVVRQMPGYTYVVSDYGSHTNITEPGASPLSEAQKLAFVYKTSIFSNITTAPLLSRGINTGIDTLNPSYNNWASGRFPFMMTADVTLDGTTKNIRFILLHAKANTSPTTTSYNRRKSGADTLNKFLDSLYLNDNFLILGDFNDDLDQTITDGINPPTTSYISFINDPLNYSFITLPLSQAGKKSTVSYNDVIDHVVASNEMAKYYIPGSATILNDVSNLVTNYGSTTTDHYPVFTRYMFSLEAPLPVKLEKFTAVKENSDVKLTWETAQEVNSKAFIIERSADGKNFVEIGKVNAAQNSVLRKTYLFIDKKPLTGNNFYRLKSVDLDRRFETTRILKISFGPSLSVSLSPNPAKNVVTATFNNINQSATIQLLNSHGQLVKQQFINQTANQTVVISLDGLLKGLYIFKVSSSSGEFTKKLLVE